MFRNIDCMDVVEFLGRIVTLVFLVGVVLVSVVLIMYVIAQFIGVPCRTQATVYELEYQYKVFGGCFVKTPELGWVLFEDYKNMLLLR